MLCHVCADAAVGRCPGCRLFFCAEHGRGLCADCAAERMQPRRRVRVRRVAPESRLTATPPLPEAALGVCRRCGERAERTCPRCGDLYCAAHAGRREVAIGECEVPLSVCARCAAPPSWGALQLRWALAWLALGLALSLGCLWLG